MYIEGSLVVISQKYCISFSEDQLWQSSRLGVYGVSGAQRARLMVQYIYVMIIILRYKTYAKYVYLPYK